MSGEIVIGPLGRMAMRYRGNVREVKQFKRRFEQTPDDLARFYADMNDVLTAQREFDRSIERAVAKVIGRGKEDA